MKKLTLIILSIAFVFGCTPKFDPSDDFKEVDVVYGVLDPEAPKQYIQVSKAFQTGGADANDLAKDSKTLFHQDSIIVEIIEIQGDGNETERFTLKKQLFDDREVGVFVNPEHYLYVIDSNTFKVQDNTNYKVKVTNTVTLKASYADIKTLVNFDYLELYNGLNLNFYTPDGGVKDHNFSVKNSNGEDAIYDSKLIIPYLTLDENGIPIDLDSVVFNVANSKVASTGDKTEFAVSGSSFINKILEEIEPVASGYSREFGIMTAVTTCYGKEVKEYVLAELSFNSLSQSKPFYSNVYDLANNDLQAGVVSSSKSKTVVVLIPNTNKKYISSQKPSMGFSN